MSQSVNELINHEAVYRTAPATPGLLKTLDLDGSLSTASLLGLKELMTPGLFSLQCTMFLNW